MNFDDTQGRNEAGAEAIYCALQCLLINEGDPIRIRFLPSLFS